MVVRREIGRVFYYGKREEGALVRSQYIRYKLRLISRITHSHLHSCKTISSTVIKALNVL